MDTTGKVTGVASGRATIWLEVEGVRGTRLFTVHPNYRGNWNGQFMVTACSHTGDFQAIDFCTGTVGEGDVLNLQVNQDRTTLSGTINLGGFPASFSGIVRDDGTISVDATIPVMGTSVSTTNWRTNATAGTMTGEFGLVWTMPGFTGSADWTCQLVNMRRVGASAVGLGPLSAGWGGGLTRAKAATIIR